MENTWQIEPLNFDRDFASFRELSVLSFGKGVNLSEEMHRWAFPGNPYNNGDHMLFVLKEGDKVIAADALIPAELYLKGQTIKMAHSVKSMTHPDYRGRGLFRIMTENSVEAGRKAGIQIILGLANDKSYGAYKKFGWPTLYEKDAFVRPLRITNLMYRRIKFMPVARLLNFGFQAYNNSSLKKKWSLADRGLSFEILDRVPEQVGACWEKYKNHYDVLQVRDFKYLNYRYNERPDVNYKCLLVKKERDVAGFAVIRLTEVNRSKVASLVEFFTDPLDSRLIAGLALGVLDYCQENSVDYTVVSTGGYGKYKETLFSLGFRETPSKPRNNMGIAKPLSDKIDIEALKDYGKWYITQGEGDTELDL